MQREMHEQMLHQAQRMQAQMAAAAEATAYAHEMAEMAQCDVDELKALIKKWEQNND